MGEQQHHHHYHQSWAFEAPAVSPPLSSNIDTDEHWKQFDNSANGLSCGFVATAILISMFLLIAIFERFLRPNSQTMSSTAAGSQGQGDLESQMGFNGKLGYPSPKMTIYSKAVPVLMPGEEIPTFIAHPAPVSCPLDPEWEPHRDSSLLNPADDPTESCE